MRDKESDIMSLIAHMIQKIEELEKELKELRRYMGDKGRELDELKVYVRTLERYYDNELERLENLVYDRTGG